LLEVRRVVGRHVLLLAAAIGFTGHGFEGTLDE